jgi:hypothetical protein
MQITKKNLTFGAATVAVLVLFGLARPAITAVYSNPVRDVDNPARQPVHHAYTINLSSGTGSAVEPLPAYQVPAGKQLVIDTISAKAYVPTGQSVYVEIGSYTPSFVSLFVPLSGPTPWDSLTGIASGTARVQAYANQNGSVQCSAQRLNAPGDAGDAQVFCYWTGHLVDLP